MKKRIIVFIFIGILVLIIGIKLYHFWIMSKTVKALNNFMNAEVGGYSIEISNGSNIVEKNVYFDNEKMLCEHNNIIEYRDFLSKKMYIFNKLRMTYYIIDLIDNAHKISNLPICITKLSNGQLYAVFYVLIVRPTEYEGRNAYKITTFDEEWIIDGESFLPVYCVKNLYRDDKKIEKVESKFMYSTNLDDIYIETPELSMYTEEM